MTPDEIEKLRLLANDDQHLIGIVMNKMMSQANKDGHEMMPPYFYDIPRQNGWAGLVSECNKCIYEIMIDKNETLNKIEIYDGHIKIDCVKNRYDTI